jgi:hypothetical protein
MYGAAADHYGLLLLLLLVLFCKEWIAFFFNMPFFISNKNNKVYGRRDGTFIVFTLNVNWHKQSEGKAFRKV